MSTKFRACLAGLAIAGGGVFPAMAASPGHVKTLYVFTHAQARELHSGVVLLNGGYYGTAGKAPGMPGGIVYRIDQATNTFSLVGPLPGAGGAYSGLVAYNGLLYGESDFGGMNSQGSIYSVDPTTNTITDIYSFSGPDGEHPQTAMIVANNVLYGTTADGGANGYGSVFSFDPASGTLTTLYSFAGPNAGDGWSPGGGLAYFGGNIYGTTAYGGGATACDVNGFHFGCGTVFTINLSELNYNQIYQFQGGSDGSVPVGDLAQVGNRFYGTASGNSYAGQLPSSIFYIYAGSPGINTVPLPGNGFDPEAGLTLVGTTLYGTCAQGGTNNYGTLFSYNLETGAGTQVNSYEHGHSPEGNLLAVGKSLIGTAYDSRATLFQYTP